MAKNFTIVNGTNPKSGQPLQTALTTKEIDILDELFEVKPQIGMVYNDEFQVLRIFSVRGVLPKDIAYSKTITYCDVPVPRINYRNIKTGFGAQVDSNEFIALLGKSWEADKVVESQETIDKREAVVKHGKAILESQKPENKYDSVEKEKARTDKASFQPVSGKPKKVKKSSKKSSKKS